MIFSHSFIHLPKELLAARGLSLDKWKTNSFGGKQGSVRYVDNINYILTIGPLNNGHQRTVLDVELKAVKISFFTCAITIITSY